MVRGNDMRFKEKVYQVDNLTTVNFVTNIKVILNSIIIFEIK